MILLPRDRLTFKAEGGHCPGHVRADPCTERSRTAAWGFAPAGSLEASQAAAAAARSPAARACCTRGTARATSCHSSTRGACARPAGSRATRVRPRAETTGVDDRLECGL
eukprot:6196853-Pleurochrysis_carterae.AAC.2